MNTIVTTITKCASAPPLIKEHKVKKLIRRVIEYVKPTHARIRYDSMHNRWAVLTKDNTAHHHFEFGLMTNVIFHAVYLKGYDQMKCTSVNEYVGIAEGELQENYYGNDGAGFKHMSFDRAKGFVDEDSGEKLTRASVLRLMTERRALYKV